jgi:hypothetical protein
MALTFQSSYMPEAMMDFLVTARGWMVVTTNILDTENSIFAPFTKDAFIDSIREVISSMAEVPRERFRVDDFLASLRTVAPICRSVAELNYLSNMEQIAALARSSVAEGVSIATSYLTPG